LCCEGWGKNQQEDDVASGAVLSHWRVG
jgi:hypothetical protein